MSRTFIRSSYLECLDRNLVKNKRRLSLIGQVKHTIWDVIPKVVDVGDPLIESGKLFLGKKGGKD